MSGTGAVMAVAAALRKSCTSVELDLPQAAALRLRARLLADSVKTKALDDPSTFECYDHGCPCPHETSLKTVASKSCWRLLHYSCIFLNPLDESDLSSEDQFMDFAVCSPV